MKPARSLARNAITSPISDGCAMRPDRVSCSRIFFSRSGSTVHFDDAVDHGRVDRAGHTQFTRTLRDAISTAIDRVRPIIACLLVE